MKACPSSPLRFNAKHPLALRPTNQDGRRFELVFTSPIDFKGMPSLPDTGSAKARRLPLKLVDAGLTGPQAVLGEPLGFSAGRTYRQDGYGHRFRRSGRAARVHPGIWGVLGESTKDEEI